MTTKVGEASSYFNNAKSDVYLQARYFDGIIGGEEAQERGPRLP